MTVNVQDDKGSRVDTVIPGHPMVGPGDVRSCDCATLLLPPTNSVSASVHILDCRMRACQASAYMETLEEMVSNSERIRNDSEAWVYGSA